MFPLRNLSHYFQFASFLKVCVYDHVRFVVVTETTVEVAASNDTIIVENKTICNTEKCYQAGKDYSIEM